MLESPGTDRPARGAGPEAPRPGSGSFWAADAPMVARSLLPRVRWAQAGVGLATAGIAGLAVCNGLAFVQTQRTIDADPEGAAARIDGLGVSVAALRRFEDARSVASDVSQVAGFLLLLALVVVVRWQNVALWNQRPFGVLPRHSPVRAFWAWVIPVWSLIAPKRVYDDLWRAADPDHHDDDARDGWLARPVPRRLHVWWAVWVSALLLTVGAVIGRGETLGGERVFHGLIAIAGVLQTAAGLLFIAVLREITDRHERRLP